MWALLSHELGLFGLLFGLVRWLRRPNVARRLHMEAGKVESVGGPRIQLAMLPPQASPTALTSTSRGILTLQGCKDSGHTIKKPRRGVPAGQENC